MTCYIGSARIDENGHISGGKIGDQKNGKEISTQEFYVHTKGWYVLRANDNSIAAKLAQGMKLACNGNGGYDQSNRLDVVKKGVATKEAFEADCSSLVRACCIYAGFDPGNFTTANEVATLKATNKFTCFPYSKGVTLQTGDILVTKTSGHTAIVTTGASRNKKPNVATPTLKKGSKGTQARYLQEDLNFLGASLTTDGVIGEKSVFALICFQKQYGLEADGIYGKKSYTKMKELI